MHLAIVINGALTGIDAVTFSKSFFQTLLFKRCVLGVFVCIQVLSAATYLMVERTRIEKNIANILQNTAVLQINNFDLLSELLDAQLKDIGEDSLPADTLNVERLRLEVNKDWLDAVSVLDASGRIIGQSSEFPLEQLLTPEGLARQSFETNPQYRNFRARNVDSARFFVSRPDSSAAGWGGLVVYQAIKNEYGDFIGSVVGLFSNQSLHKMFLQNQRSGLVLGGEGVLVIYDSAKEQLIYQSLRADVPPGIKYKPKILRNSEFGDSVKYYVSPLDGEKRLGVFKTLPKSKWTVLLAMSPDDYLAGWRIQLGISILALLFMALLQWMVLNFIHRNQLQSEKLKQDSLHDPLTGLANRRNFDIWSSSACSQSKRYMQPLSLLALDLDHFKRVNDKYGHDGGDAVLKAVADTLRANLRECDLAARFGGEEFIIALPQTPPDGAMLVAERVRAAVEAQTISLDGRDIRCTVSIGLALVEGAAVAEALKQADLALYQAKEMGRNRVISSVAS